MKTGRNIIIILILILTNALYCDPPPMECASWAIIVNGDYKETECDIDNNRMYKLLVDLGYSEDNIFYLSNGVFDGITQTIDDNIHGVDGPSTLSHIENTFEALTTVIKETDKFLFFFSGHGESDQLVLHNVGDSEPVYDYINAVELAGWLDAINCDEQIVILSACRSGSFIGKYKNTSPYYRSYEDDLTHNTLIKRCVFTSASSDTDSQWDRWYDGIVEGEPGYDINPCDEGTETMSGFFDAFYETGVDMYHVQFTDAVENAIANDSAAINNGPNLPQFNCKNMLVSQAYLYCRD